MEHTIRRRARGRKSKERKLKGVVEVPNFSGWCAGVGVYFFFFFFLQSR